MSEAAVLPKGRFAGAFERVRGNAAFFVGVVVFGLIILVAVFAPLIATHDPLKIDFTAKLAAPSTAHLFGTDELGRDIFSRVVYGARTSLTIGLIVTVLSALIGTPFGLVAGYFGGRIEWAIMRMMDVFIAFPPLLLPIAITAAVGQGLYEAMLALTVSFFPWYARIVHGEAKRISGQLFVKSARAQGFSNLRIMFRHVLPNAWIPAIIQASMDFGYTILAAASLSFIGIGAKEPDLEWGLMVALSRSKFLDYWWVALVPGLAIFLTVFAVNLIGDGVNDMLDPKGDSK
ncbi:ABC transporter permease [Defluviimonas salinarum]|uniref:ABC transporter permease n=1 Tax=Defluviimonas salinarum TaxID=2992147 RepID=A0ABT3J7H2_9RHOB|nr:ABC transporter permease [Defluviimonas salinarum]MCW3783634.1 ABC transporter permease [Defluviimonas salinarum]